MTQVNLWKPRLCFPALTSSAIISIIQSSIKREPLWVIRIRDWIISYKIVGSGEEILSRSLLVLLFSFIIFLHSRKHGNTWKDHVVGVKQTYMTPSSDIYWLWNLDSDSNSLSPSFLLTSLQWQWAFQSIACYCFIENTFFLSQCM